MNRLKLIVPAFFLLFSLSSQCQTPKNSHVTLGFQLNQFQKDFGLGLQATSPFFLSESVALRVRANMMYHEHVLNQEITWTPYTNIMVGILGGSLNVNQAIRLYGEGGIVLIQPDEVFSSSNSEFGGYGIFGFEFYFTEGGNYFIELGAMGTGARADKIPLNPIYSNGFSISTGLRIHL